MTDELCRLRKAGKTWRLLAGFLVLLGQTACSVEDANVQQAAMSAVAMLSDQDLSAYQRACFPREFSFQDDHGAHPDFKNEWWYLSGNVSTPAGRRFGYQFTVFRSAVAPIVPDSTSDWSTNQIYLAHAALTDIDSKVFHFDEQIARGAMGLAGADSAPLHVWLNNWSIMAVGDENADSLLLRIDVISDEFSLELELKNIKPVVLHGKQGLSAKSPRPCNASYYYSYTRMETSGLIFAGDQGHPVSGESWFDHEWSTSALEPEQSGWDWFSLQLSDKSEVMLFRLRDKTGPAGDYYSGTVVDTDGAVSVLDDSDIILEETSRWQSRVSGANYPAGWKIHIPRTGTVLVVTPELADQELNTTFRYWEGTVEVSGTSSGMPISGKGYVELTGYE